MAQMTIELSLALPLPWMPRATFDRLHWAAKGRIAKEAAAKFRAQIEPLGLTAPLVDVSIDCYRTDWRELDKDNLYGGLKPYLDAMTLPTKRNPRGIGLIVDDRPSILVDLQAHQYKCKKGDLGSSVFLISGKLQEVSA